MGPYAVVCTRCEGTGWERMTNWVGVDDQCLPSFFPTCIACAGKGAVAAPLIDKQALLAEDTEKLLRQLQT